MTLKVLNALKILLLQLLKGVVRYLEYHGLALSIPVALEKVDNNIEVIKCN